MTTDQTKPEDNQSRASSQGGLATFKKVPYYVTGQKPQPEGQGQDQS